MSIRRYLVLTLFAVLTLITFVAAIQGYKISMKRASHQFDRQLIILAETLLVINSASTKNNENEKAQHLVTPIDETNSIAFQVWKKGVLTLKTDNAPNQVMTNQGFNQKANNKNNFTTGFSEDNFLGQRWRTYTAHNKQQQEWVIVAQPLNRRFILAQDVILSAVTPMIIAIVILSVLIYWVITQGLKPLRQLTYELSNKKANDLTPLSLTAANSELEPVIATLNQLFSRLNGAFERERHFASDAAHELRTPLSVLKINVHNVQRELVHDVESMDNLIGSVERMSNVIDQILNLNRTSPEQILLTSKVLNINSLIQSVISQYYGGIAQRQQSIELDSRDDLELVGNEFAIALLVQNLITNASKYTPVGGTIKVSTAGNNHNDEVTIVVEDSGPGIAESEYERVFDRFYRVGGDQHDSSVIGCGLGLAIVKHIAELHSATIILSRSTLLNGLKVSITFPYRDGLLRIDVGEANV